VKTAVSPQMAKEKYLLGLFGWTESAVLTASSENAKSQVTDFARCEIVWDQEYLRYFSPF
jgi:hypothetical protein